MPVPSLRDTATDTVSRTNAHPRKGTDMSAGRTEPKIITIGARDDFLHVYHDDRDLLQDDDIGAGVGESRLPVEFFDSEGYRLAGVYDGQWHLLRLMRTTGECELKTIQRRVQNVIDHIRSYIEAHPDVVALYGMTVQEALELIPRLDEITDLAASLLAFTGDTERGHGRLAVLGEKDTQGFGHAMQHLAGTAHK